MNSYIFYGLTILLSLLVGSLNTHPISKNSISALINDDQPVTLDKADTPLNKDNDKSLRKRRGYGGYGGYGGLGGYGGYGGFPSYGGYGGFPGGYGGGFPGGYYPGGGYADAAASASASASGGGYGR